MSWFTENGKILTLALLAPSYRICIVEMVEPSNLGMPVRKRLRFRDEDDMALLREVASHNPFANAEVWGTIQQNLYLLAGKEFSLKTLKDHLDLLIKLWLEKTKILKDKSGIEEEYSEKDQLCQDIYEVMRLFRGKDKKKTPKKQIENAGKINRDLCANLFYNDNNEDNKLKDDHVIMEITVASEPQHTIQDDHLYCKADTKMKGESSKMNVKELAKDNLNCVTSGTRLDFLSILPSTSKTQINKDEGQNMFLGQNQQRSKVLGPIRSRKRKANMQKQGLSYLEQYDKVQTEIKKQDQALEERKIALEEKKIIMEEKKLQLSERKLNLEEDERKKLLNIVEQPRKDIRELIEKQDKLIQVLLLHNKNQNIQ